MNKERLLKLAAFIEKLPPRKVYMGCVARLNGAKRMNPFECTSVACAMGWTPAVFPHLVAWAEEDDDVHRFVCLKRRDGEINEEAMTILFDIDESDALSIFNSGREKYHTPKQVALGIREYVKTGKVPPRMLWK